MEVKQIIDRDFAEWIRTDCFTVYNFKIDVNSEIIVPLDKTHDFLMKEYMISGNIRAHYYSRCHKMFPSNQDDSLRKSDYKGDKGMALRPYFINIDGAYYDRCEFLTSVNILIGEDDSKLNGKSVKHLQDLLPFFKNYAAGFKEGYNNFENDKIKKYLPMLADKNDVTNKVFDYLTKEIFIYHGWSNKVTGLMSYQFTKDNNSREICGGFKSGLRNGYYYKAWEIVFSNKELFQPLFENNKKSIIQENLESLITHAKSKKLVILIKEQYKNIKGKRLKLLLITLQELKLLPEEQIAAKFHRCCKNEFDWEIGSYQAMNDYRFIKDCDSKEVEEMKCVVGNILK